MENSKLKYTTMSQDILADIYPPRIFVHAP